MRVSAMFRCIIALRAVLYWEEGQGEVQKAVSDLPAGEMTCLPRCWVLVP